MHGQRHRDHDLPAFIAYRVDGSISNQSWYQQNQLHRDSEPANIKMFDDGTTMHEWYTYGVLQRKITIQPEPAFEDLVKGAAVALIPESTPDEE